MDLKPVYGVDLRRLIPCPAVELAEYANPQFLSNTESPFCAMQNGAYARGKIRGRSWVLINPRLDTAFGG
jgi:hypothetical protein